MLTFLTFDWDVRCSSRLNEFISSIRCQDFIKRAKTSEERKIKKKL